MSIFISKFTYKRIEKGNAKNTFCKMKLTAENIEKSYRGRKVVKGISLSVEQGEIVGLLGPNGAGKTTSFYMIVGLIKTTEWVYSLG